MLAQVPPLTPPPRTGPREHSTRVQTPALHWSAPALTVPELEFSAGAVLSVGLPLVVLSL